MDDRDFCNWLAGWIDGEGSFFIARTPRRSGTRSYYTYRPSFSLTVRVDDRPILDEIIDRLGIGTVHEYEAASCRVARWSVQSQGDCERLIEILRDHPLRAKKRTDFLTWCEGVEIAAEIKRGRGAGVQPAYDKLSEVKRRIEIGRKENL